MSRATNCEFTCKKKGAQISRHMERLADLHERRRRLSRARRPAPVALDDWATAAAAPSAGVAMPWASRRAFQSSSESGSTSGALGASIARTGRARASGSAETGAGAGEAAQGGPRAQGGPAGTARRGLGGGRLGAGDPTRDPPPPDDCMVSEAAWSARDWWAALDGQARDQP